MSLEEIKLLLKDFVNRNSQICNIEWDPSFSEPLQFNPFDKSHSEQKKVAHYFLLVASITESNLVRRAENARVILTHFHKVLGDEIFNITDKTIFEHLLKTFPFFTDLGENFKEIPNILVSVNLFVQEKANNDLLIYAKRFLKPIDMVSEIGLNIGRMSGSYSNKSWMYMEWMTRKHPNLKLFSNFSSCDLYVPLTSYIRAVASCLHLIEKQNDEKEFTIEELEQARRNLTKFANQLYPNDPCMVSYPFYLLGRWIRGKNPSLTLLQKYLQFFDQIFKETQTVPVTYDVVSREMSKFEENIASELQKMNIIFSYESHKFNLPKGLTYLPDFVLPNCKVNGKTVLLEPHGVWTQPIFRKVKIGGKNISFRALPPKMNESEIHFIEKMKMFRRIYGKDFYVDLLVPSQVYERVKSDYPFSYDEIFVGTDVPKLLYSLKNN